MNTPYEFSESRNLIERLFDLTKSGKIQWSNTPLSLLFGLEANPRMEAGTTQYATPLEDMLEASVWINRRAAGFRLIEREVFLIGHPSLGKAPERELLSIMIAHEHDPQLGPDYVALMGLIELARRAADKVEPKVDRAKQYLDKLTA
jgi:hypothetical protein